MSTINNKNTNCSNKLLILTNSIGGLHSFRREVVKAICDAGYEVVISAPEESPKGQYFKEIGCEVVINTFNRRGINPCADFKQMLAYRRLMKDMRPVAVLTYTIKPNIYGGLAARLCGVPQIANITGLGDALENGGWLQKLSIGLYKLGLRKARCVFFQNNSNRESCIRLGIANEDSKLLPGSGVNLQHHTFQPYPQDDGKITFLFIGRLLKDKGIEEYLSAAKTIKKKYQNTEFRILGNIEGSYQFQLAELTRIGVVDYLGTTIDVRPFIGDVHCTIMPSYHEGMSNVNLESAANGRPVITTNVPGCRETVDNGKTGFLVEAKSAQSLAEGIERFIALPYNDKELMGQNARQKVENEFDRQIVVEAYLKVLEELSVS